MFAGEFHVHAETGGLFRLPPVVRAAFPPPDEGTGQHVVVLKSLDRSLWLYPAHGWQATLDAARERLTDEQSRLLMHYVVAESVLVEIDAQGRLALPMPLRHYAEITTELVLIGMYERLEAWGPGHWSTYIEELEARHDMALGKILDLL